MATAALARPVSTRRDARFVEDITLGALVGWTLAAIAGFALVHFRPQVLAADPAAARIYAVAFPLFARAHVLLATLAIAVVLIRRTGGRWLGAFAIVYALSLTSELAGTLTGLPFGAYRYTDALGWKWLGVVPALIPLSWFYMVVPSYALAARAGARGPIGRIVFGSLVLLAWDLALDPAMSGSGSYWVWGDRGPYYGMPLLNLVGWYVTGLVLASVLELTRASAWLDRIPTRWLVVFYGANLLLPVGLAAVSGMWGAVTLTIATVAVMVAVSRGAIGRGARRV